MYRINSLRTRQMRMSQYSADGLRCTNWEQIALTLKKGLRRSVVSQPAGMERSGKPVRVIFWFGRKVLFDKLLSDPKSTVN